jgi:hypothetical protein
MNKSVIVALGYALVLLVVSCGDCGKPEAPAPGATGATTPSDTPAVPAEPDAPAKGKTKAEKLAESPAEITKDVLPKFYPADLPTYPDAKPGNSIMVGGAGLVVLSVKASSADVLAHYRDQLPAQGWTIDQVSEKPPRIAAHKEGRKATISISSRGEQTEIGVALSGE